MSPLLVSYSAWTSRYRTRRLYSDTHIFRIPILANLLVRTEIELTGEAELPHDQNKPIYNKTRHEPPLQAQPT